MDFLKFTRKLRLAVFFHRIKHGSPTDEGNTDFISNEHQQNEVSNEDLDYNDDYDDYP